MGPQHPSLGLAGTGLVTWRDAHGLSMSLWGRAQKPCQGLGGKPGGIRALQTPTGGSQPSTQQHSVCGDAPRLFWELYSNLTPSTYLQNKPRTARRETGSCYLSNLILFHFFFLLFSLDFWRGGGGSSQKCALSGLRLQPG